MNFVDLDGNPIIVKIKNNILYKQHKEFSKLHGYAKNLTKKLYPLIGIYEDVPIEVRPHKILFIDLFLPEINLAIEVHGRQHYVFTPHYHASRLDFLKKQYNDQLKKEWCNINNIRYVELPYNEKIEQWKDRIYVG